MNKCILFECRRQDVDSSVIFFYHRASTWITGPAGQITQATKIDLIPVWQVVFVKCCGLISRSNRLSETLAPLELVGSTWHTTWRQCVTA